MNEDIPSLEQRCIRPGEWMIEGWNCRRVQDMTDSRNYWWVCERFKGEYFHRHNLADVREVIAEKKEMERTTEGGS
jgi:hypothetical protein